jgi:hypothetical protein
LNARGFLDKTGSEGAPTNSDHDTAKLVNNQFHSDTTGIADQMGTPEWDCVCMA